MEISQQEAQQSLRDIEAVMTHTRRALAHGGGPYYMLLWGTIWFLGFGLSQFASADVIGWGWALLDTLGALLSVWIGFTQSRRVRSTTLGPRLGLFWLALFGYAFIWMWLQPPASGMQLALMLTLYTMFGYVVMGLWLHINLSVGVGLAVSAIAVATYFLLPGWFYLTMAVLGGGTLFASGWVMLKRWGE